MNRPYLPYSHSILTLGTLGNDQKGGYMPPLPGPYKILTDLGVRIHLMAALSHLPSKMNALLINLNNI